MKPADSYNRCAECDPKGKAFCRARGCVTEGARRAQRDLLADVLRAARKFDRYAAWEILIGMGLATPKEPQ